MKYAICNELFEGHDPKSCFQLARELGYTGLEVAPFTLGPNAYEIPRQRRLAYSQLALDCGLEVLGLHWLLAKTEGYHLTTSDPAVRRKTAGYLRELVQLCSDLGGNMMVLGSPAQRNFPETMTHDEAVSNAAEVLMEVTPDLERAQVRLAVEPLGPQEGNFLNTASQARTLIERIASPWVRLHLDVKAMSSEGSPIDQIVRENADLMVHFHANDPNRLGPGMGDIDQQPIFQALKDIGYSGWVSVEVFDYSPGIEAILRQSMRCMKQCEAHAH
ncbi:MAG: sugar phosphate isomerase/epimerase [Pirellula sp.]|nr:sugar phosphate isomerase/epimerase [Pirellula sp.]